MFEAKVVKRGNSLALTLPSSDKFSNFKLNSKWLVIPNEKEGTYTIMPKISDPYRSGKKNKFYVPEEWSSINQSDVE